MTQTVSDFIVQRLHQWGVRHIFGYPGDGINGVFGALQRADGKIGFVQARLPMEVGLIGGAAETPLPPHVTLQQAKNFSLALMKGDPNEAGVIKGAARQMLESILPGKE